jgi:bifunctional DNase/RNase
MRADKLHHHFHGGIMAVSPFQRERGVAGVRLFASGFGGAACLIKPMAQQQVVPVHIKAVVPTANGAALFLGTDEKTFVIYVDATVGHAINMFMAGTEKERPLTHDLMAHVLAAFGAKVDRAIINDVKNSTFYARLIVSAENELHQRKIIELDARPSDCIAMAIQQKAPILVSRVVLDEVDDASDALKQLESSKEEGGEEEADEEESSQ